MQGWGGGDVNQYFKTHLNLSIDFSYLCMLLSLSKIAYVHDYDEGNCVYPVN